MKLESLTSRRGLAVLALSASLSLAACTAVDDGMMMNEDDSFSLIYMSSAFQMCAGCHAPSAPGKTVDTEATQDWTTRDTAYSSLKGMASNLMGNFAGCNGVPFIGSTPDTSLLVAAFDETIRSKFTLPDHPDCTSDAISDMTLKIGGPLSADDLALLKMWVSDGAPDK